MAEKKYKVADGVALTAKGVMFKAGDALPADVLTDDTIKTLVAAKKIVEDKGESKSEEKKSDDKKSEDKKTEEKK